MTGGTPPRTMPECFNGEIKWLVSGDIHQRQIFDCEGRINDLGLANSNAKILPVGSVIIALNGQGKTRGSVAMLRTDATCNQSLVSIMPKDTTKLLPEFVFTNLRSRYDEIRRMTGDAGNERRGLNMRLIRGIELPLPPLDEQKRIVAVLDEAFTGLDRARANAEANLQNARELFDTYLSDQFVNGGVGNRTCKVGDLITLQRGFDITKKQQKEGPYPVVSSGGAKSTHNVSMAQGPGVVVGRKGSIGSVHFVETDYWPHDTTLWVKDFKGNNPRLVYYLLRGMNLSELDTGAANPSLNRNLVHPISVNWPSDADQKNVADRIFDLELHTLQLSEAYQEKIIELSDLRQSLLQKAFAGELT